MFYDTATGYWECYDVDDGDDVGYYGNAIRGALYDGDVE